MGGTQVKILLFIYEILFFYMIAINQVRIFLIFLFSYDLYKSIANFLVF